MTDDGYCDRYGHEPSEYAMNKNAAEGVPLWCDECGATIEYAGYDSDGRPSFRVVPLETGL